WRPSTPSRTSGRRTSGDGSPTQGSELPPGRPWNDSVHGGLLSRAGVEQRHERSPAHPSARIRHIRFLPGGSLSHRTQGHGQHDSPGTTLQDPVHASSTDPDIRPLRAAPACTYAKTPSSAKALMAGSLGTSCKVPPAGFEPAHTAPEAVALSPELRGRVGRGDRGDGGTPTVPGG